MLQSKIFFRNLHPMHPSNINPFEYVSILISIILGLGITQILSAFTDLLYDYKKVKFYWPHLLWIGFLEKRTIGRHPMHFATGIVGKSPQRRSSEGVACTEKPGHAKM